MNDNEFWVLDPCNEPASQIEQINIALKVFDIREIEFTNDDNRLDAIQAEKERFLAEIEKILVDNKYWHIAIEIMS